MRSFSFIPSYSFIGLKQFLNCSLLLSCCVLSNGFASDAKHQGLYASENSTGYSSGGLTYAWWTDPGKSGVMVLTQELPAQLYLFFSNQAILSSRARGNLSHYPSAGLHRQLSNKQSLELSWQRCLDGGANPSHLFAVSVISSAKNGTNVCSFKVGQEGTQAKWQLSMHWQPALLFSNAFKAPIRRFSAREGLTNHPSDTMHPEQPTPSSSSVGEVVVKNSCEQEFGIAGLSKELFAYVASYVIEHQNQQAHLSEYNGLDDSLKVIQKIYANPLPIDDASHEQGVLALPAKLIFIECLSLCQMAERRYPIILEEAWKLEAAPLSQKINGGFEFEAFKCKEVSQRLLSTLQTSFLFGSTSKPVCALFSTELEKLLDIGLTNEFGFRSYVFRRLLNFGMHVACGRDAYLLSNDNPRLMRSTLTVGAYLDGRSLFTEHGVCLLFSAELWAHSFDASLWHAQCLFESSNHSLWRDGWLVGDGIEEPISLRDAQKAHPPGRLTRNYLINPSNQPEKRARNYPSYYEMSPLPEGSKRCSLHLDPSYNYCRPELCTGRLGPMLHSNKLAKESHGEGRGQANLFQGIEPSYEMLRLNEPVYQRFKQQARTTYIEDDEFKTPCTTAREFGVGIHQSRRFVRASIPDISNNQNCQFTFNISNSGFDMDHASDYTDFQYYQRENKLDEIKANRFKCLHDPNQSVTTSSKRNKIGQKKSFSSQLTPEGSEHLILSKTPDFKLSRGQFKNRGTYTSDETHLGFEDAIEDSSYAAKQCKKSCTPCPVKDVSFRNAPSTDEDFSPYLSSVLFQRKVEQSVPTDGAFICASNRYLTPQSSQLRKPVRRSSMPASLRGKNAATSSPINRFPSQREQLIQELRALMDAEYSFRETDLGILPSLLTIQEKIHANCVKEVILTQKVKWCIRMLFEPYELNENDLCLSIYQGLHWIALEKQRSSEIGKNCQEWAWWFAEKGKSFTWPHKQNKLFMELEKQLKESILFDRAALRACCRKTPKALLKEHIAEIVELGALKNSKSRTPIMEPNLKKYMKNFFLQMGYAIVGLTKELAKGGAQFSGLTVEEYARGCLKLTTPGVYSASDCIRFFSKLFEAAETQTPANRPILWEHLYTGVQMKQILPDELTNEDKQGFAEREVLSTGSGRSSSSSSAYIDRGD